MAPVEAPIRAGLIFQQQELADRLKKTLIEAGIDINAEFNVESLRSADLSAHQIEVYIVNLEPEIEDLLDEVTDLLEDASMPVVFNDAGVSSDLSGWDQARWARHLASKIRKGRGNLPPMPENAQVIPTPKREQPTVSPAAAADPQPPAAEFSAPPVSDPELSLELEALPEAETPSAESTASPAIAEPESAELESVADAVLPSFDEPAADAVDTEATAEFSDFEWSLDDDAPTDLGVEVSSEKVDDSTDAFDFGSIDERELEELDLLDEDSGPPPGSVGGDREAYASELAAGLSDDDKADAPDVISVGDGDDLSWGELPDLSEQSVEAEELEPTESVSLNDQELLADLLDAPPNAAAEEESLVAAELGIEELTVEEDSLASEFDLGPEDGLTDLEAPSDSAQDWDAGKSLLAELDTLSETEFDPGEEQPKKDFLDADDDFGGLDLDLEVADEPLADDGLVDLDAMLAAGSTSADDEDAQALPKAQTAGQAEAPPSADADVLDELAELPDLDSWSLEPVDDEGSASSAASNPAASETPTKRVEPVPEQPIGLGDLQLSLDDLGLVPMDDELEESATQEADASHKKTRFGVDLYSLDDRPPPDEALQSAPAPQSQAPTAAAAPVQTSAPELKGPRRIVILGASIGGPDSIRNFLSRLNTNLGAAFILVQHMGAEFLDLMAQQLDRVSPLGVHLARHGHELKEGEVVIAPVGQRLSVDDDGKLDLSADAGPTAYSPSIDQVLTDSLQRWGADRLLVIIFSGMASDAVEGSKKLAAAGAPVWAQDPASCVISSMVDGVVAAKVVSFIGSPEQLADQANKLLA